jgi:hypothetical protein
MIRTLCKYFSVTTLSLLAVIREQAVEVKHGLLIILLRATAGTEVELSIPSTGIGRRSLWPICF